MKHLLTLTEATATEPKYAILFTDVKGSSELWHHPSEMMTTLDEHTAQVQRLTDKYDGLVVKTIGDAFMLRFDQLESALAMATDLQTELKTHPLKVKGQKFTLRIGIAYGPMYEKDTTIQGQQMKDYFGNTVNTASRMESKVAEPGQIVFTYTGKVNETALKTYLEDKTVQTINFSEDCRIDFKRSGRLLTDRHNMECKSVKALKGVEPTVAYQVQL